jgi:hypothetical protein
MMTVADFLYLGPVVRFWNCFQLYRDKKNGIRLTNLELASMEAEKKKDILIRFLVSVFEYVPQTALQAYIIVCGYVPFDGLSIFSVLVSFLALGDAVAKFIKRVNDKKA